MSTIVTDIVVVYTVLLDMMYYIDTDAAAARKRQLQQDRADAGMKGYRCNCAAG
jgi:hypothetical protein